MVSLGRTPASCLKSNCLIAKRVSPRAPNSASSSKQSEASPCTQQ
ncbi:Uncharacterised protein [Vibrio cholerae]|nr:Uncharacterised protein [Vibrio cholerae]